MRRPLVALLCLLLASGSTAGDEGPAEKSAIAQAADDVLTAVHAEDAQALRLLAERFDPDPWLVVDVLWARGELDAGLRLARASDRPDLAALPAHLESLRDVRPAPAVRTALARAEAATHDGDAEALLAATRELPEAGERIARVRLLHGRATALRLLKRFAESRQAFHEAGVTARAMGWLAGASKSHYEALLSALAHSDYRAAYTDVDAQLVIERERQLPGEVAAALGNLATVLGFLGRYEEAERASLEALEAARALGLRQVEANALSSLGSLYLQLLDLERAVHYFDRSYAMQVKLGHRVGQGKDLGNLGIALLRLGRLEEAAARNEQALAIARETGHRALALNTLIWQGHVRTSGGQHARALSLYEEALRLAREMGDRPQQGWALQSLANLYERLGALDRARAMNEEAVSLAQALGDPRMLATSHQSLGTVLNRLGEQELARASLEKALAIAQAAGDIYNLGHALNNLGAALLQEGDVEGARSHQDRALAHARRHHDATLEIWALAGLASTEAELGNWTQARRAIAEAQEVAERGDMHQPLLNCLIDRARIELRAGDHGRSIEVAREAVHLLGSVAGGLADEQAASARGHRSAVFEVGALASVRAKRTLDLAFFLESGRAGALLESLGARDALRGAAVPPALRDAEIAARAEFTRAVHAVRRARAQGHLPSARARRVQLEAARAKLQHVVERIQREAKHAAQVLYPECPPLAAIQGGLEPRDALLLFGVFEEESVALVVSREGARVVRLGPTAAIREACAALNLEDPEQDPTPVIARLRRLLVAPLELAEGTTRLLVSPQDEVSYVPFALLAHGREVVYVPSGATHLVLREERARRGRGVLGLGDPDYRARIDTHGQALYRKRGGNKLSPLPATRAEVEAIADVKLLGAEATESRLRAAIRTRERWRAVHLACHGLVDPEKPMFSSLALTVDDGGGFLTCFDVFRMRIPADLVVLSACETAKGRVVKAEGIVGLTRAFMFAGAPRVICSLWKVDDAATQALMVKFYELWNPKGGAPGLQAAAALRQAQAFVRDHPEHPSWKHPSYWAAWVLWGAPD